MKETYDYTDKMPHAKYLLEPNLVRGVFKRERGQHFRLFSINGNAEQYEVRWEVRPKSPHESDVAAIAHFGLTEVGMMDAVFAFAEPGSDSIVDMINPLTNRSWIAGETLDEIKLRYPKAEIVNMNEFCQAKATRQDAKITWKEITEERYWEMLECLPPAYQSGKGFLLGEPADHHATLGVPRFAAFVESAKKFYESSRPMTVKEFTEFDIRGMLK